MKSHKNCLENDIASLEKRLDENNLMETEKNQILDELAPRKLQREEISKHKTKGPIIWSKARWYNNGEKIHKYFLNLEKQHFNKKNIKSLLLSDNRVIKRDDEILRGSKCFYQQLYTSTVTPANDLYDDLFFQEENTLSLILSELEQKECRGPLTETECWESLKSIHSNKRTGSDGLQAEFFKLFWKEIHHYLLNALNYAYRNGLLSVTQRRGLITLIPKKNKATKTS